MAATTPLHLWLRKQIEQTLVVTDPTLYFTMLTADDPHIRRFSLHFQRRRHLVPINKDGKYR
jgi:hypothetical protein